MSKIIKRRCFLDRGQRNSMSTKIHVFLQTVIYIERARRKPRFRRIGKVLRQGVSSSGLEETRCQHKSRDVRWYRVSPSPLDETPSSEHFSYVGQKGFASSPLEETQVSGEIVWFCEKWSLDDPCQGKPLFVVVLKAAFSKKVLCFHSVNAILLGDHFGGKPQKPICFWCLVFSKRAPRRGLRMLPGVQRFSWCCSMGYLFIMDPKTITNQ